MNSKPKLIVITGCTRGCGRALFDRFREAGHIVIGCGRDREKIDELNQYLEGNQRFRVLDVTDDAQVEDWAKQTIDEFGVPDLLINNAAVINRSAPLWEIYAAEFDRVIDINIKGVANVLRHFLPAMVERQSGTIVNFSSGWGRSTSAEVAPYCATKFAIEGLTKALAQELPPGMAAVPLNPGVINTEMLQSCWPESAHDCPTPEEWSHTAAPLILGITPEDNGQSLSVG